MTMYNYQDFLSLDDATYNAWEPRFNRVESQALSQVKAYVPDYDVTKPNKLIHSYCEEVIFITLFGDDLQTNLYNYHQNLLSSIEQRLRYTDNWRNQDEASIGSASQAEQSR